MTRLSALALCAAFPLLATPALADCLPGSPAAGEAVACTGIDGNGFSDSSDGLTITVAPLAEVSNAGGDAIRARGTGNTVLNFGTIAGTDAGGSDGIDGGVDLTVTNFGTIEATNKAIDADERDGLTVSNYGTITAVDKAIRNADGLGATLTNLGTILSETDEGFETGDAATILNTGTISGFDDAIQVGQGASIINSGLIVNSQTLADLLADPSIEAQDAIDIDSGEIINLAGGEIRSTVNAAIDFDPGNAGSVIRNWGLISGTLAVGVDGADEAGQAIANFGTLVGTSGTALDLGLGDDSLALHSGSSMVGGAAFGAGTDSLSIFDGLVGTIGGTGAIFDGGDGFDTVRFASATVADIVSASFADDVLTLGFSGFGVAFSNWETFSFADAEYATADLVGLIAPVPLPGTLALLLPALGLLGWAGRRRAA